LGAAFTPRVVAAENTAFAISAADKMPTSWAAFFQPLPSRVDSSENPITENKVTLGKKLYLDTSLSINGKISCNSCHGLTTYGVDNEPTSPGHDGTRGSRNSPSVYNAALHFRQFWDGRAKDVEEQALGPVLNPVEMAMPAEEEVMKRLNSSSEYPALFKAAFPEDPTPISFKNVGKAIGAFERTLLTPSRFDHFLKGDDTALSDRELKGMVTFRDLGCVACHNGVALGGQMYQKVGLLKPYPTSDLGRYQVTKNEADKFQFKVPSLRNIAKTGPYFHDGQVKTLEDAIRNMGEYQLGKNLSQEQVASIVDFLGTLTGELPK
jgi:cytochrome c peroxidase